MKTVSSREDFLREVSNYMPKGITAIELGVLNGEFSKSILNIINPDQLILVDPFEANNEKYEDGLTTAYSTEQQYIDIENSLGIIDEVIIDRDYSYNAVHRCYDNSCSFIYIDASHLYKDVKRDLNDWLPKLKEGGIMAGHDYANVYGFGVVKAVDEFCIEHNFEMIIFNTNGFDWALKRK